MEASITNNSGNWVSWGSLFDLWKVTVEGSEGHVDRQDHLKNSDSLKKMVGKNPMPEPPERDRPNLPWEYSTESRVTEILRAVTLDRRHITNAVNDMESHLKMYSNENIGNIETQMDSLTREEV